MACDYCQEGNTPIDGWHTYPDPDDFLPAQRVPCADNPPVSSANPTDFSPNPPLETRNHHQEGA